MRDTAHSDLVDFAMLRAEALARHHRAMIRANGVEVEKALHFRQLIAIMLFTVNLLVWGSVVVEWMNRT